MQAVSGKPTPLFETTSINAISSANPSDCSASSLEAENQRLREEVERLKRQQRGSP
jgi:hypothetical protein